VRTISISNHAHGIAEGGAHTHAFTADGVITGFTEACTYTIEEPTHFGNLYTSDEIGWLGDKGGSPAGLYARHGYQIAPTSVAVVSGGWWLGDPLILDLNHAFQTVDLKSQSNIERTSNPHYEQKPGETYPSGTIEVVYRSIKHNHSLTDTNVDISVSSTTVSNGAHSHGAYNRTDPSGGFTSSIIPSSFHVNYFIKY
jgi:hypothetical protein